MVWERWEDTKARRTELIGQESLPVVRVDLDGRCPVVRSATCGESELPAR